MDSHEPSASSSTKKWLIGCGIGCAVVVLIAILLGLGGYLFIRNIVQGFEDSEAIMSMLTERYGRVEEYCPEPDGTLKSGRIEAFLAARDAILPLRERLEESLLILDEEGVERDEEKGPSGGVLQKIRVGFGLVPQIADFFKARNQALLDVEMGLGEYYHIYSVAYFSWLGKPVMDGPPFQIMGDGDYRDWNDEESREIRRDMTLRRLHRMLLSMLENQYAKLIENPSMQEDWSRLLAGEIEAMKADRYRMIWQEGLPDVIISSLAPFRQRLEESYSPLMNALEIVFEQR